ncbi:hypothetical protein CsSME_00033609 [Camellia sinensis var. sinensis]
MRRQITELACDNMRRGSKYATIYKTSMQQHAKDGLKPRWADLNYAQISGHNAKMKAPKTHTSMHTNWLT